MIGLEGPGTPTASSSTTSTFTTTITAPQLGELLAEFSDSHNGSCTKWTEIKNSYLIQNNEKLIDDDCGVGDDCGCPRNLHDNRIVMDVTCHAPPAAASSCSSTSSRSTPTADEQAENRPDLEQRVRREEHRRRQRKVHGLQASATAWARQG